MDTPSPIEPAARFLQGYALGKWGLCLGPRTAQAIVRDLTAPRRRGMPPGSLQLRGRRLDGREIVVHTLGAEETAELLSAMGQLVREPGPLLALQTAP